MGIKTISIFQCGNSAMIRFVLIVTAMATCLATSSGYAQEIKYIHARELSDMLASIETLYEFEINDNRVRLNREIDHRSNPIRPLQERYMHTLTQEHHQEGEGGRAVTIINLPRGGDWEVVSQEKNDAYNSPWKISGLTITLRYIPHDGSPARELKLFPEATYLRTDAKADIDSLGGHGYDIALEMESFPSIEDPDFVRVVRREIHRETLEKETYRLFLVRHAVGDPKWTKRAYPDGLYLSKHHQEYSNSPLLLFDNVYYVEIESILYDKDKEFDGFNIIHRIPASDEPGITSWTYKRLRISRRWGSFEAEDLGTIPPEQWKPAWDALPQQILGPEDLWKEG